MALTLLTPRGLCTCSSSEVFSPIEMVLLRGNFKFICVICPLLIFHSLGDLCVIADLISKRKLKDKNNNCGFTLNSI